MRNLKEIWQQHQMDMAEFSLEREVTINNELGALGVNLDIERFEQKIEIEEEI